MTVLSRGAALPAVRPMDAGPGSGRPPLLGVPQGGEEDAEGAWGEQ